MSACVTDDDLQAFLEHTLSPERAAAAEAHFATCDGCRALLAAVVRDRFPRERESGALPTVSSSHYVVEAEIARGGLGRILRAEDTRLGRPVALKELLDTKGHLEGRFVREALIAARLEHPGIVPVHEVGRWPTGEPFYAMKLVSGQTLQQVIRKTDTLAGRLALLPSVIAVAEAIAYAHEQGVIHRDLKPANVVLGQFGEAVVVDWGLAKSLRVEEPPDAETNRDDAGTIVGAVMGTPAYMPPEQARGEPVDERADVYALGAILYEVLAGVAPYGSVRGSSQDVLEAVIRGPAPPLEDAQAGVPSDLLAVVRKAMARNHGDRYPTAKQLAADLRLFQTGQLVSAREYTTWSLATRWLRRHRLPAGILAIALVASAAIGVLALDRVLDAWRAAESAQALADRHLELAVDARVQAETRTYELILLQARALMDADPTASLAWLKQIPVDAPLWADARAYAIEATSRGYASHVWRSDRDYVGVMFSPDGRRLVATGRDQRVRTFDVQSGAATDADTPGTLTEDASFAANGDLAAAGNDGTLVVWPSASPTDGSSARTLGRGPSGRQFVAFSPDGSVVASVSDRASSVLLWDVATGTSRAFPAPAGALEIAFAPDGTRIATGSEDKVVRVWDIATGSRRELTSAETVSRIVFSPDSSRIIAAELDGVREWTLATGAGRLLPMPRQRYIAAAIAPDGGIVAAAGFEGGVHLLDLATGDVRTLRGHEGMVTDLDFSPDGRSLASTAHDHTVRIWRLPEQRDRLLGRIAGTAAFPTFSPDGAVVAVGGGDGRVHILSLAGAPARALAGHRAAVFDVAFAPDGASLASQSQDQTARIWNLETGTSRVVAETVPWVDFGRLQYSSDGRFLACSLDRETLAVLDARSGERACTFGGAGFNLAHAFSPDSAAIAFTAGNEVRLGDLASCASRPLYSHDPNMSAYVLAFSPDGARLASSSDDWTIGLHTLATGETTRLRGHDTDVYAIAFSPDGRTLVSGSGDRTVRLWDVATATATSRHGHDLLVGHVAVSGDGRIVASAGHDFTVRLWDVASSAGTVLRGHRDKIKGIAFSPDGKWVVSGSQDGTVRLWPADATLGVPVDAAGIKAWLDAITSARIDGRGRVTGP